MEEDLKEIIKSCYSKSDFARALGKHPNGEGLRLAEKLIRKYCLDTCHFVLTGSWKLVKHPVREKICPVCSKKFIAADTGKRAKTTCSHSCSNTFFRTGIKNGSYKLDEKASYRSICFRYHKKECVICGESNIVSVHHFDENHFNNAPENLVPLCPTHHHYLHSSFKNLILKKVQDYIRSWTNLKILAANTIKL
jgi:hypothetical protein